MASMLWVGRLFEERYTFARVTMLNLSGVGYLVLSPDGRTVSSIDLAIAIFAFAFGYVHVRSPFSVVFGLSAVSAAGFFLGADNDMIPVVGLAWALVELGARRSGRQVWLGLALGIAGGLCSDYSEALARPFTALYTSITAVGMPLLFGLYIRSMGLLARQAADRATQELSRVRAQERTSIARELHDLVAHHVASIVLRVGVARNVLPLNDPRVSQVLDDVHATGTSALADLRRLVSVLRDPGSVRQPSFVDPEGLPVALSSAIQRSEQIGLTVEAEVDSEVVRLDSRTALAVLRLTQEGLANVAKHAGTSARARLAIRVGADQVEFDLQNLGNGVPEADVAGGGHGLIGLRERVEVLGGRLKAGPDGPGWRLQAQIPFTAPPIAPAPPAMPADPAVPAGQVGREVGAA
jgi:signal transduction histidine kinase